MMTTSDVGNMIYTIAKNMGISVFLRGNIPGGEITEERVTIHPKTMTDGDTWERCYVEVNINVPDIDEKGTENLVRLAEVEKLAKNTFQSLVTSFEVDGVKNWCWVDWESVQRLRDNGLKSGYINVRVLVEHLNI